MLVDVGLLYSLRHLSSSGSRGAAGQLMPRQEKANGAQAEPGKTRKVFCCVLPSCQGFLKTADSVEDDEDFFAVGKPAFVWAMA